MNIRSSSSIANKLAKEIDLENENCALTVEDYAQLRNLGREETEVLEKYTSEECKQLCAIVTAAKGFVREEVGEGISEERIAIVAAACSLVGKVGYFWGGKSYTIGWDSMWGSPMQVTAAGESVHRHQQRVWTGLQRFCVLVLLQWTGRHRRRHRKPHHHTVEFH